MQVPILHDPRVLLEVFHWNFSLKTCWVGMMVTGWSLEVFSSSVETRRGLKNSSRRGASFSLACACASIFSDRRFALPGLHRTRMRRRCFFWRGVCIYRLRRERLRRVNPRGRDWTRAKKGLEGARRGRRRLGRR